MLRDKELYRYCKNKMIGKLFCVYAFTVMIAQPNCTKATDEKSTPSTNSPSENQCLQILCSELNHNCFPIDCSHSGPVLPYGSCVTFSEDANVLSRSTCRYFEPKCYHTTSSKQILLPSMNSMATCVLH